MLPNDKITAEKLFCTEECVNPLINSLSLCLLFLLVSRILLSPSFNPSLASKLQMHACWEKRYYYRICEQRAKSNFSHKHNVWFN